MAATLQRKVAAYFNEQRPEIERRQSMENDMWTEREQQACQTLVQLALAEDLSAAGDLTSQAIIPADLHGQAAFVARAPGIISGLPVLRVVFAAVAPEVRIDYLAQDGALVRAGD